MNAETLASLRSRVARATGQLDDETLARVICAVRGWEYGSHYVECDDDGSDELSIYERTALLCTPPLWSDYRSRCPDVSLDAALRMAAALGARPAYALAWALRPVDPEITIDGLARRVLLALLDAMEGGR